MSEELVISEVVRRHNADFEKDRIAMSSDIATGERMMSVYTGYDDGGYDPQTRNMLRSEGKHLPQFNIVKPTIRKIAGNLIKDFLDKDFVPLSDEDTDLARAVKGAYLSDKNHFDYDESYMECCINGLIHLGCEYLYIDTKFNEIGNLAFKSLKPSQVIIDPNWKTNRSSDIQVVWVIKYLTAKQIKDIYNHRSNRIDELIAMEELKGLIRDADDNSIMPYMGHSDSYGNLHRVVEKHYLEVTAKTKRFVVVGPDERREETEEDKTDEEAITITRRVYEKTYRIQTSCITLDSEELLEDRDAELQIERLPFFPWSAERINGRNCGKVESVEDSQTTLNKRERLATSIIESAAHGAQLIDPMLFGSDMTLARQAVADFNKSDAKIFTAPGALATNQRLIMEVPKTQYQGEVYNDIVRMREWIRDITGQTSSMDGVKESSHDTGVLMEQRVVQSNIAMTVLYKGLEIHELQKAEAWFAAARILYKDTYREFFPRGNGFKEDGEVIKVNDRIYTGEDFKTVNDFSQLPEFKVIVKQSKQGVTVKEHDAAVAINALNVVSSPLKRLAIEGLLLEAISDSSEQRENAKRISDIELQAGVEKLSFEIAAIRAQKVGLMQQLEGGELQNEAAAQQVEQGGEPPVQ